MGILRSIGLNKILDIELIDPQFIYIKTLTKGCELLTPLLSYLNALISYRLNCKGELYWYEFSQYFRSVNLCSKYTLNLTTDVKDRIFNSFSMFLKVSKCNKAGVQIKLKRLTKILPILKPIYDSILSKDFLRLWKLTYESLRTRPESKTVVFSVKMAYYGLKALRQYLALLPMDIPIPVDIRIAKVTYYSGLLIGPKSWRELYVNVKVVVNVWNEIAYLSSIPPLHIDSLIWLLPNKSLRNKLRELLGEELLRKVMRELSIDMLS